MKKYVFVFTLLLIPFFIFGQFLRISRWEKHMFPVHSPDTRLGYYQFQYDVTYYHDGWDESTIIRLYKSLEYDASMNLGGLADLHMLTLDEAREFVDLFNKEQIPNMIVNAEGQIPKENQIIRLVQYLNRTKCMVYFIVNLDTFLVFYPME